MNEDITQIPIKDFLEGIGVVTRKEGSRYFCSSPFSSDRNWSFCIYPTNTYFDFSTGHGGNIINLVSRLYQLSLSEAAKQLKQGIQHEKYQPNYKKIKQTEEFWTDFKVEKYTNKDEGEIAQIRAYAESRGITDGYFPGVFFTRCYDHRGSTGDNGLSSGERYRLNKWIRVPALGFLHVDKNLQPCGAKFRRIIAKEGSNDQSARFSARGNLGFYLMRSSGNVQPNVLYIVESESSANSLYMYLKGIGRSAVVVSRGGVSSAPNPSDLPEQFQKLQKKLIIDYDGNEQLYNERLKLYSGLDAQPIKLILPKGEDLNSLYCKGEMWKVEQLLLN